MKIRDKVGVVVRVSLSIAVALWWLSGMTTAAWALPDPLHLSRLPRRLPPATSTGMALPTWQLGSLLPLLDSLRLRPVQYGSGTARRVGFLPQGSRCGIKTALGCGRPLSRTTGSERVWRRVTSTATDLPTWWSVPLQRPSGLPRGGGIVHVLYGAARGLTAQGSQVFHQDSPGVQEAVDGGEGFGWALTTSDFNGDGFADLAVSATDRDAWSC